MWQKLSERACVPEASPLCYQPEHLGDNPVLEEDIVCSGPRKATRGINNFMRPHGGSIQEPTAPFTTANQAVAPLAVLADSMSSTVSFP